MSEPVDEATRLTRRWERRRRARRRRRLALFVVLAAGAAVLGAWIGTRSNGGTSAAQAASSNEQRQHEILLAARRRLAAAQRARLRSAQVTIAWGGDTVLGSTYGLPAGGPAELLVHVAPTFRAADIGWLNLEEAMSNGPAAKCAGSTSGDCFAFGAPMSYASALPASGISIVNLANNHFADYGAAGEASTLAALRAAHVAWDGKPGQIELRHVHGLRIAVLGFAPYPWASRLDRIPAAVRLVKKAAAEADLVLVAIHAGAEGVTADHVPRHTEFFLGENRGNSRAFTHAVIDAGADLVVGSGPHVIRGVEWYRGRLIAYSLGNLAGWKTFGLGGALSQSAVLTVTLRGDGKTTAGHWTSVRLADPGVPELDSSDASLALVGRLSRADFGSHAARFDGVGDLVVSQ